MSEAPEHLTLDAAPGETVTAPLRLTNDTAQEVVYRIAVAGIGESTGPVETRRVAVPPRSDEVYEVPIAVPFGLGIGQHAAALEITAEQPGAPSRLVPFTISIASVHRVAMHTIPSPIRGRRRARFHLDIVNNEPTPVQLTVDGAAEDVAVRFARTSFDLAPGVRGSTTGKAKSLRRANEPMQHNLVITARGRAATTSITVPFIQTPLLSHRARMFIAGLTIMALWVAATIAVVVWRQSDETADEEVVPADVVRGFDTDGDGVADLFVGPDDEEIPAADLLDTDGDGVPDEFVDFEGDTIPVVFGKDTDGDGVIDEFRDANGDLVTTNTEGSDTTAGPASGGDSDRTADGGDGGGGGGDDDDGTEGDDEAGGSQVTVLRGTVTADGSDTVDDVTIRLVELAPGTEPDAQSTIIGPQGFRSGKIWPDMATTPPTGRSRVLQTQPVEPAQETPQTDGTWAFTDVAVGTTFELRFSKPNFESQSFIVSPRDQSPVLFDVALEAATGGVTGSVTGPSGPLGGVRVEISDGVLAYTTTTPSEGEDVGAWRFEELSSGHYTVVADLEGFGTAVTELDIAPGERVEGISLDLQRGIGALTGTIFDERDPLGGAQITVTSGDFTAQATSVTGNPLGGGSVGFYSIGGLELDKAYTVSVAAEGYQLATRRISPGNLSGQNFVLQPSEFALEGTVRVRSAERAGRPIKDVTVTVQSDLLEYRASTNELGEFTIDRLPPGTYVVEFDHYRHESVAKFIEVTAGVPNRRLDIGMRPVKGTPTVYSEMVRVEVTDAISSDVAIDQIRVTVTAVDDDKPVTPAGDDAKPINRMKCPATCRVGRLPIGTYTFEVTGIRTKDQKKDKLVKSHNDAEKRASIGIRGGTVAITVQRLGQALGTVIDATTGEELGDLRDGPPKEEENKRLYRLSIVERLKDGSKIKDNPTTVETVLVHDEDAPPFWQTVAPSLVPGYYRIVSRYAPLGYAIPKDQKLESGLPPMMFRFGTNQLTPLRVKPIEAAPYPVVSGTIYRPLRGQPDTFGPLLGRSIKVTLDCDGTEGKRELEKTVTDATFSFDYREVDEAVNGEFDPLERRTQLVSATCELKVKALDQAGEPKFYARTVDSVKIAVRRTANDPNVTVNAALTPERTDLEGTVFWYDERAEGEREKIFLDGVKIEADDVAVELLDGRPAIPQYRRESISDVSEKGGKWSFPGDEGLDQVFGSALYEFTPPPDGAPAVVPGSVEIVIDDDGQRSFRNETNLLVNPESPYDVELTDPKDGRIEGATTIVGTAPFDYADVALDFRDPDGGSHGPTTRDDTSGTFEVDPAAAGSWSLEVTSPEHHVIQESSVPPELIVSHEPWTTPRRLKLQAFVDADTTNKDDFKVTILEQGEITLRMIDGDNQPLPGGTPIRLVATPRDPDPFTDQDVSGPDQSNFWLAQGLPVDRASPSTARTSDLRFEVDGYDVNAGEFWNGLNPVLTDPNGNVNGTPLDQLALDFTPGEREELTVRIPEYGSLSGRIIGDRAPTLAEAPGASEWTEILSCDTGQPPCSNLDFDVQAVTLENGQYVPDNTRTAEKIISGEQFTVTGPPGLYRFDVDHPDYADPVEFPVSKDTGGATLPAGIFELTLENMPIGQDDPLRSDIVLNVRRGELSVSAVDALRTANAVPDATCTLVATDMIDRGVQSIDQIVAPCSTGTTVPNALPPGVYQISVVHLDANGVHLAHPAATTITVGFSRDGQPRSTTSLTMPLPPAGNTLQVMVSATNPALPQDATIPLPASGVTLHADFAEPAIAVEVNGTPGTSLPNTGTVVPDSDGTVFGDTPAAGRVLVPNADGVVDVQLPRVPSGSFAMSVDPLNGYDLQTPEQTVVVPNDSEVEFVYHVPVADVFVELTGFVDNPDHDDHAGLAVQLAYPSWTNLQPVLGTRVNQCANKLVYRFPGVVPVGSGFGLTVTHDLYADVSRSPEIGPQDQLGSDPCGGTTDLRVLTPVAMSPTHGRFIGTVRGNIGTPQPPPLLPPNPTTGATGLPVNATLKIQNVDVTLSPADGSFSHKLAVSGGALNASFTGTADTFLNFNASRSISPGQVVFFDPVFVSAGTIEGTVTGAGGGGLSGVTVTLSLGGNVVGTTTTDADGYYSFTGLANNTTYGITVTPPAGYYAPQPATATTAPGSAQTVNFALTHRTVTLNISGADTNGGNVSVTGTIGATAINESLAPTVTTYEFSSVGTPAIPLTGTPSLTVSQAGRRTQTVSGNSAPAQTLGVTLRPDVTLSGVINGLTDTTISLNATAAGSTLTPAVTLTKDGACASAACVEYTVSGLGVTSTGGSLTWRVTIDVLGAGTATIEQVVTQTSPSAGTATVNATLDPRSVTVAITVTDTATPANGVTGANVTVNSAAATAGATTPNVYSVGVLENVVDPPWTAAATGFLSRAGSITSGFPNLSGVSVPVTLYKLGGTVSNVPTGKALTVQLCPAAGGNCVATASVTGSTYSFSGSIADGDYSITATSDGKTKSESVTIAAGVPSAEVVNIALPTS